ncbi:MBL fold metallo-hydrolase [Roseomonas sp. HF4]|uniref:MBL fold metallo-hydrolase n=1 Tax=Roseomonas sp. HF4 TaxID=2562313 RepID=UPI001F0EE0A0|nr:MBL fold metallo-hydrolase [Roseomonas sp. HF4]
MIAPPTEQGPGFHHRRVGDIVVTCVSDGFLEGSMAVLQNITVEDSSAMLRAAFRPVPRQTQLNCYLIQAAGRVALVDTGAGVHMQKTSGLLPRSLAAAGVAPADIDTVLLTHMHPDHSNGLAGPAGEALFPNAELVMHAAEPAYWMDEAIEAEVIRSGQGVTSTGPYFPMGRRQIAPYRDRTRLFTGGEVFPGVTAVPLPGHTPGHTGYLVASGAESLLIWGDIIHVPEVQVARPEVTIQFDVDPGQAATMRRRMLDMAASERIHVAGMHLHFPGTAHILRDGDGFRLVADAWSDRL